MKTVISLRNEEREALLDAFSMCNTYLHEEAALAAQYFDDLNGYCPDNIALCEPLETVNEEEENFMFLMALESFGITSAHALADQSGASDRDCIELWGNPIRCNAETRARVIKALDNSIASDLWNTPHIYADSVGDYLYLWLRRNFKTPYKFERVARECELKSYLVGAVSGLSDRDLESLLHPTSFAGMLQDAAKATREQRRRGRAAAEVIDSIMRQASQKHTLRDGRQNLQ